MDKNKNLELAQDGEKKQFGLTDYFFIIASLPYGD